MVDRYEALEQFARLRDEGVLSDAEFEAEKAKLLAGTAAGATMPPPIYIDATASTSPAPRSTAVPPNTIWWVIGIFVVMIVIAVIVKASRTNPATPIADANAAQGVPSCDSTDARNLLTAAIAREGGALLSVDNAVERMFDTATQVRTCAANLTLTNVGVQHRPFRLLPASDGTSYRVELMPAEIQPAVRQEPATDATPAAVTDDVEAEWADPCTGHYLGQGDEAFSLDVTNRPLDARIQFADFGAIDGRQVRATAPGRLSITDDQTKEVWTAICSGDDVELRPQPGSAQPTLTAHRSTEQLQMSADGEGEQDE